MTKEDFFKIVTKSFSSSFDLYSNYRYNGKEYLYYGYFYNHNEKYVLTRDAKLWEANCYEHLFFIDAYKIVGDTEAYIMDLVKNELEPHFVRNDRRYPASNHMYSLITLVIINDIEPSSATMNIIRSLKWSRSYLLTVRGDVTFRVVSVTPDTAHVVSNKAGREMAKLFQKMLDKQ